MKNFENNICNSVGVIGQSDIENKFEYFKDFAISRMSCRNFDISKEITEKQIQDIIHVSIKTPSVCNRQHWKAHIFQGGKILDILAMQNGNMGFSENIPYLAVITSDLRSFYLPNERTQAFTDGGMFAMTFIYTLHSFGISSCALNWCTSPKNNEKLYNVTNIEKNESVMMLIAFGYASQGAKKALSPRLELQSFYTINKD